MGSDDEDDLGEDDLGAATENLARSGARWIVRPEETEVAIRFVRGDTNGAIALAARVMGPAIGRLCFLLLGSQGEADEAAQETMLAAYHSAASYRSEGTPRAWFFGIARRICIQRLQARARQARRIFLIVDETTARDPSSLHDQAEREANVRAALSELSEIDREALILRYDGDQSFREMAEALGIDEPTARKRVSRALVRLRQRVQAA
ncbi:MAG: RNA polymerase sigma factor [Polyangiales bacterium]